MTVAFLCGRVSLHFINEVFTMQKFIPYAKLSKKAKRAANNARRATWGDMNPVTRTSANPRAYNRAKNRRQNPSSDFDAGFSLSLSSTNYHLRRKKTKPCAAWSFLCCFSVFLTADKGLPLGRGALYFAYPCCLGGLEGFVQRG